MQGNSTAITSSRLDRVIESPEILAQLSTIGTETIAYCIESLNQSRFFTLIKNQTITSSLMQYAFLQYRFWRDRLHQWFGLCIVKASSCTDPDQKTALMSLADHIFTDLQDGHNEMYLEFLHELGLSEVEIQATQPSAATKAYERSFFDDFGYGTENFDAALAALSGRELCVSVRNRVILQYYFDERNIKHPVWLALHAEVEMDHFYDAIRPTLSHHTEDATEINTLIQSIHRGIDRHVQYFEELLHEYEAQT